MPGWPSRLKYRTYRIGTGTSHWLFHYQHGTGGTRHGGFFCANIVMQEERNPMEQYCCLQSVVFMIGAGMMYDRIRWQKSVARRTRMLQVFRSQVSA